ncbi:hypothetical protein DL769_008388 [Monosporascus sp. CRB-8-3]|nr:hypothetical protein DL769_008388 [Monosporascus sp. CRB-8-3]
MSKAPSKAPSRAPGAPPRSSLALPGSTVKPCSRIRASLGIDRLSAPRLHCTTAFKSTSAEPCPHASPPFEAHELSCSGSINPCAGSHQLIFQSPTLNGHRPTSFFCTRSSPPSLQGASSKPRADVCLSPDNFSEVPCSGSSAATIGGTCAGGSSLACAIGIRGLGAHGARQRQRCADCHPLRRAEPQRAAQDAWATRKADEFASCPYGFPWLRDDKRPGYRCAGGAHYMSGHDPRRTNSTGPGPPGGELVKTWTLLGERCHRGLRNWDREPTEQEQVPPGYYGPIRPVGVDERGRYTYFEKSVDWEKTSLRKQIEPTAFDWS